MTYGNAAFRVGEFGFFKGYGDTLCVIHGRFIFVAFFSSSSFLLMAVGNKYSTVVSNMRRWCCVCIQVMMDIQSN